MPPIYLKRLAGMRFLGEADFITDIPGAEKSRLEDLSRAARGNGPTPIIVLGIMPRSGTNFIRDALALHPDTLGNENPLHEFPLLHSAGHAAFFADDYLDFFPASAQAVHRLDPLALLAGGWFRALQKSAGNKRLLLKSPHVHYLDLAPYIFADARIVICIRDGRDVVDSSLSSFKRVSLGRKTFSQLADEWRLGAEAIRRFGIGGDLANPNVLVIRYEDLHSDPDTNIRSLLAHCELEPERYDFDSFGSLPVRGSSRSEVGEKTHWRPEEKPENFSPIGRWKSWTPKQISRFDRIAGDALRRAGYD